MADDAFHFKFLADRPEPTRVATLDPDWSLPDSFAVVGGQVYLRDPDGLARSKLTKTGGR